MGVSFKVKVSDIMVDDRYVQVRVFIAPEPDQTYQRCGELSLTPAEAKVFKERVESAAG